jgi:phospholipase C
LLQVQGSSPLDGDAGQQKLNAADSYPTFTQSNMCGTFRKTSFDHHLPHPFANNPANEPQFNSSQHTGREQSERRLLTENPNSVQPFRLIGPGSHLLPEPRLQQGTESTQPRRWTKARASVAIDCPTSVTAPAWSWATTATLQLLELRSALLMSDNFFNTQFGPSTPGAVNLIITLVARS